MAMDRATVKKLQKAINIKFNQRLVVSANQWYSKQADRPITTHIIKKLVYDEVKKKDIYIELYKSTSLLQIGLYLRDMWYELNGWELPEDTIKRKENTDTSHNDK